MSAMPVPVEVFCSYAHEDEDWLRKLETHLSPLQRQGLLSLWHDRLISPGTNWTQAIDTHLETASVILLLVSADFLASDYCYGMEMQRALKRQEAGEARVIPILVRPSDWQHSPFAHLQVLPTDAKPLASRRNKDTALSDVAAGIRRAIKELPQLAASAPPAVLPPVRIRHHKTGAIISLVVVVVVAIVIIVAVMSVRFGWWVSTPPVPMPPTQTLNTFCSAMIADNNEIATAQFTSHGLQDFQPSGQKRKAYSLCQPGQLTTLTDRIVTGHLVVKSVDDNRKYGITVTLILDGNRWKIDVWKSVQLSAGAPLQLYLE